ncbi:MAG: prolyl oligopeptidase family serine peptidase [Candidatus Kerfeldbacteria bacterium]
MPRRKLTQEIIKPLTAAVIVIMIVAVVILKYLQLSDKGQAFLQQRSADVPSLDEILDQAIPDTEEIESLFEPKLGIEALHGYEAGYIARDGETVRARLSKPEGDGPFPAIIIIHDAPASSRATDRVHDVLGERLMEQFNALTFTVDWRDSDFAEDDLTDVISAVDEMSDFVHVKDEPVIVLGLGYGAYLSLLATRDVQVDGIIIAYPYIDPADQFKHLNNTNQVTAQTFLQQTGCTTALQEEQCLRSLAVTDEYDETVPMLVLHNSKDALVPAIQSERLTVMHVQTALTVLMLDIENGEHDFLSDPAADGFEQGYSAVVAWIETLLRERAIGLPDVEEATQVDDTEQQDGDAEEVPVETESVQPIEEDNNASQDLIEENTNKESNGNGRPPIIISQ